MHDTIIESVQICLNQCQNDIRTSVELFIKTLYEIK